VIGAALGIEESTHYAEVIGPLRALQVVLRAVCYGAAQVRWTLQRLAPAEPQPDAAEADGIAEAGAPMPDPIGNDT
jgi:hypothetical protein